MKDYIGGHEIVTASDLVELALGTPIELWLGVEGETDQERSARLDAARDILTDEPGLAGRSRAVVGEAIEAHMPDLFRPLPFRAAVARHARPAPRSRSGRAAA